MSSLVYSMLVNVNGMYYVHVCEKARWARSAGNSAIENVCIIIIFNIALCRRHTTTRAKTWYRTQPTTSFSLFPLNADTGPRGLEPRSLFQNSFYSQTIRPLTCNQCVSHSQRNKLCSVFLFYNLVYNLFPVCIALSHSYSEIQRGVHLCIMSVRVVQRAHVGCRRCVSMCVFVKLLSVLTAFFYM